MDRAAHKQLTPRLSDTMPGRIKGFTCVVVAICLVIGQTEALEQTYARGKYDPAEWIHGFIVVDSVIASLVRGYVFYHLTLFLWT